MRARTRVASREGNTGQCSRCGCPCVVGPAGAPDAQIIRRATKPGGVCAACALTGWLKRGPLRETLDRAIDRTGVAIFEFPAVRAEIERLMRGAKSDATPEEIDWDALVANWNLPAPKTRG